MTSLLGGVTANNRFQPTFLPPLRSGKNAAEPERSFRQPME